MATLYHYTTGAGLIGMLKDYSAENPNLMMWATHYMFMNDPDEFIIGEQLCIQKIAEVEEELHIAKADRISIILQNQDLESFRRQVKRKIGADPQSLGGGCPYLISLSQVEDSLHMWNMYAVNGNGIAIAFDEDKLRCLHKGIMRKCVYHNEDANIELKQLIKQYYEQSIPKIVSLYQEYRTSNEYMYKIMCAYGIAARIFMNIGAYIKNRAYMDEAEYRIIISSADKILFRDKEGSIIPYVEQKIPFECVENIIVGPTADFERYIESILLLLYSKGIDWDEKKIIKSKVPYRK